MEFGEGTSSTDRKGHGYEIRTQLPPALTRAIQELAGDPLWPFYRTKQDVVRDALYRLVYEIGERQPDQVGEVYQMAMVEMAQDRRSKRQEFLSGVVDKFTKQFSYAVGAEEVKEILQELRSVLGMTLPGDIRAGLERVERMWE